MTKARSVPRAGGVPRKVALASVMLALSAPLVRAVETTMGEFTGPFDAGAFHLIASTASATVPGVGVAFTATKLVGVLDGAAAFKGTYVEPSTGATRSGLYSASGGSVSRLADGTLTTPGGETIQSIVASSEWIDGQLTFAADTSVGQKLYRLNSNGSLTTLFSAGESVNDASPVMKFTPSGVAGDSHGYAFSATLADGSQAIYQSTSAAPSSAVRLADDKTRSPVPESGSFVDFPELSYRGGSSAFIPRSLETDREDAVVEPVGVLLGHPGNPTRLAAFKTGQIVGSPDTDFRFNEFEKPRLFDHDGGVALSFTGGFTDEEDGSDEHFMGVFTIEADGGWKNWINSDLPLPGLRDDVEEFNGYAISDTAFAAGAVDGLGGRYIYAEIGGTFQYVLSTYDTLDGKAISAIRWSADDIEGSQLYFTADFADGSSGIYRVAVPEPTGVLLIASGVGMIGRRRR